MQAQRRLASLQDILGTGRFHGKSNTYSKFELIPQNDPDRANLVPKLNSLFSNMPEKLDPVAYFGFESERISRGVASLVCLGVADALGASTEFMPFDKDRHHLITKGFDQIPAKIQNDIVNDRGEVGVWTDDCSMSLCLADSILANNFEFNGIDIRYRFLLWLEYGLNNGGRPYSIGLGGNIAISMHEFWKRQDEFTEEGDKFNNGNGSLMRLAPAAIGFIDDVNKGMDVSGNQSRTTHNGEEAKECCRLLARVIITLINRKPEEDPKKVLLQACDSFVTPVQTVACLARGQQESDELFEKQIYANGKFKKFNRSPEKDRRWTWRSADFTYSETRRKLQPGYIGSYCMDGLSMALFTAYHTNSAYEAIMWAVNMGGDCDTVGAIVGQITGAMYGLEREVLRLYSEMPDVKTKRYQLFLKGYKLSMKRALQEPIEEKKAKLKMPLTRQYDPEQV